MAAPLRSRLRQLREMRLRANGVGTLTLVSRLIQWRLCGMFGLHPVIRAHGFSRLRMFPTLGDYGIAKGVFLLRENYELSVRTMIDSQLSPGGVAIDIGANMGLWTLRMAERVGKSGRVIAFEPGPTTQNRLRDNIALSGHKVELHGFALGANAGELVLNTPGDSGSATLGTLDEPSSAHRVQVKKLDTVWRDSGCPQVSLVKMDVEGAEPMVLAGATEFFAASRPVVCCEVNQEALARLGYAPEDVHNFFRAVNYRAMIWDQAVSKLVPLPKSNQFGKVEDVVFLPEENPMIRSVLGAMP